MNLEQLKLRLCISIGIPEAKEWRFYLGLALLSQYAVLVKEPINELLYNMDLSQTKPIAQLEVSDMFDLDDLKE